MSDTQSYKIDLTPLELIALTMAIDERIDHLSGKRGDYFADALVDANAARAKLVAAVYA